MNQFSDREATLTPVDLSDLLGECCSAMAALATERDITVTLKPFVACSVKGDRQKLAQVVLSLMTNAIEYNRRGGSVAIEVMPEESHVAVSFSDTGFGLSESAMAQLFTSGLSSGLGLITAQSNMEEMQGMIAVSSEEGHGSCFTIILPQAC